MLFLFNFTLNKKVRIFVNTFYQIFMAYFQHILVVDDDSITIMIVEKMAKLAGFAENVHSVLNGLQAKNFLANRALYFPHEMPEIILLDLQMSVMSGWEFLDWYSIWQSDLPEKPPVYIFSSSLNLDDEKRANAYSVVVGFIIKPLTNDILLNIARERKKA